MKKKFFIDSDVLLDLLAERPYFYDDAARILSLAYKKKIELYTTAVVLANVFYILRKVNGKDRARGQLKDLRLLVKVLPINENIVDTALSSRISDFEDGLQYFTAKEHNLPGIITRNSRDYKIKDIAVQTPREFIQTNRL
ncbi:MAG: PIN domain-containing protein [Candidatus Margulisbacteria bacterium]|jgi:predicted nucleic acid-binding protein|nr:PIN domain-containing protein [Candidatus Margulisiibacteriota bacterium]